MIKETEFMAWKAQIDEKTAEIASLKAEIDEIKKSNVDTAEKDAKIDDILKQIDDSKEAISALDKAMTERKNYQESKKEDGKFGFSSLQEFFAKDFESRTTGNIDPRINALRDYEKEVNVSMTKSGMDTMLATIKQTTKAGTGPVANDSTYGGGLIPPAYGGMLVDVAMENTGLWNLMSPVPMSVPTIDWSVPANWDHSSGQYYGGVYVSSTDEIATISEVRPQWDKVRLDLNAVKIITAPSNKIIMFSPVTMEGMLKDMLGSALQMWLVDKMINGKGSGEPLGIINTTGVMGLEIAKESGQTADTITLNNILDMKSRCYRGNPTNLRWIANYDCEPELRKLHITIGASGAPVYGFASGDQPFDRLLGIPVVFTEFAQKLGDAGDLILVDPTQYFRAYMSTAPTFSTSTDVYFVYDQTAIKLVFYCDARPKWTNVLTPRYATTKTMSPYCVLAERA